MPANPEKLTSDDPKKIPSPSEASEALDSFLNFPLTKKKKKTRLSTQVGCPTSVPRSDDVTGCSHKPSRTKPERFGEWDDTITVDLDLSFEGFKKKRKSTKKTPNFDAPQTKPAEKKVAVADRLWNTVYAEYTYDYLLTRFYQNDRPPVDGETTGKLVLKPPLTFRVGSKKTSFANFLEICKALHRPPQHLMAFLLVEMGTSGSLDGSNQLIIKGRFQQHQIENIIRRYIKEYVRCITCGSLNTMIQKHIRLTFLVCGSCESQRSVVSIKSGYQAVTGKRAAIRAKAAS